MLSPLRRRRCLVVAALLFVPAVSPAQARKPGVLDEDVRPEVVDLKITGVKSVDADQLRAAISTDQSRCRSLVFRVTICPFYKGDAVYVRQYLDPVEFRRDVLRMKLFYYERGYRDAQVDTAVTRAGANRVRVSLSVAEGPPTLVDTVIVERAGGLIPQRRRRRLSRLRKGDPLDLLRLDSTVTAVREALGSRGYADAEVGSRVSVNDTARRAAVTIVVDPKRRATVDTVEIRGNSRVSDETVRNSLRLDAGDIYRLSDVAESQRRLYESGLFRRADISTVPPVDTTRPQTDSAKTLVVTLQEALPRAVRTSVGFNTFEFIQAGGSYTNYSLLGGARRLDLQGAVGNLGAEQLNDRFIFKNKQLEENAAGRYYAPTYSGSVNVTQRWFRDPRNTLSGGVFAQRRSAPLVFVDESYGAIATFTRELAQRSPVSLGYRFEVSGVEAGDVYFCVNFGVCERETIDALNRRQRISPLSLTASTDRTSELFSPTTGYRARTSLEHASAFTASDFRYNRLSAEASYYRPTFRGTLATRVRAGWVRPLASVNEAVGIGRDLEDGQALLQPRTRFYAGGSQSVRGYGENQLGPRVLTIPASVLRGRYVDTAGVTQYAYCPPPSVAGGLPIQTCDPNPARVSEQFPGLTDTDFVPRPLGGDRLLEANVEYRFPLVTRFNLSGAVFLDGAVVSSSFTRINETVAAVTPGFGVRYRSPVGPIRVDVGINPSLSEDLRVITEATDDDSGGRGLIELQGTENPDGSELSPSKRKFAAFKRGGAVGNALGRFVLHLSIGEAF